MNPGKSEHINTPPHTHRKLVRMIMHTNINDTKQYFKKAFFILNIRCSRASTIISLTDCTEHVLYMIVTILKHVHCFQRLALMKVTYSNNGVYSFQTLKY